MLRLVRLAVVGALATLAAVVPVVGASPAQAATLTCQQTFHSRPTTTGWISDPCAQLDGDDGQVTYAVRVQFYWSQTGGAHITDIRGTLTICSFLSQVDQVSADAVALHKRSDFSEYASSTQPRQVATRPNCATMITISVAMRGCGAQDNPLGPNAYASYTESRGQSHYSTNGLWFREPASGYFTTPSSYYITVVSGAAC